MQNVHVKLNCRIVTATTGLKKVVFTSRLGLNLKKKLLKWYIWDTAFEWC
jgi:hypothetical protein